MSKIFKVIAVLLGLTITIAMFLHVNGILPKKESINNNKDLASYKEYKINTSTNKEKNNTNVSKEENSNLVERNILISSSNTQGIVSINSDTKEVDFQPIKNNDQVYTDKYINVDKEYMEYLQEHSASIMDEFNNGSIIEKYSLINSILDKCDTNLSKGDLINIALNYLK